jgi:hypothetical protein
MPSMSWDTDRTLDKDFLSRGPRRCVEAPSDTLQVLMWRSRCGSSPAMEAALGTGDVTKALLAEPLLGGPPFSCGD